MKHFKLKCALAALLATVFAVPSPVNASMVCSPFCDIFTVNAGDTLLFEYDFTGFETPQPQFALIRTAVDLDTTDPGDSYNYYRLRDGFVFQTGFSTANSGIGPLTTDALIQTVIFDILGSFDMSAFWLRIDETGVDLDRVDPSCVSDCETIFHPAIITLNPSIVPPPTVVPLPAALPLFLSALAGLGLMGWRRRQAGA